jgi:hypothetical protein
MPEVRYEVLLHILPRSPIASPEEDPREGRVGPHRTMMKRRQRLPFIALVASALASSALGCGTESPGDGPTPDAPPADEAPLPPLRGARVNVVVAGRGVVTSDPLGIRCGNDGDQRSCDLFFPAPDGDAESTLKLTAAPNPDWYFTGWHLVRATGEIAYDEVRGFDGASLAVTLDGRARYAADGSERPAQYRLEAIFSPTVRDRTRDVAPALDPAP